MYTMSDEPCYMKWILFVSCSGEMLDNQIFSLVGIGCGKLILGPLNSSNIASESDLETIIKLQISQDWFLFLKNWDIKGLEGMGLMG